MYTEKVNNGRVNLGRVLNSLHNIADVNDSLSASKEGLEGVAFMQIKAETGAGRLNAIAVMTYSYAEQLISGFERISLIKEGWKRNKNVRRAIRSVGCTIEFSVLSNANRAYIPPRMRAYVGIPLYGSVFVAERNGYSVISQNPAISEIETASGDARATTIDKVVAAIAHEKKL